MTIKEVKSARRLKRSRNAFECFSIPRSSRLSDASMRCAMTAQNRFCVIRNLIRFSAEVNAWQADTLGAASRSQHHILGYRQHKRICVLFGGTSGRSVRRTDRPRWNAHHPRIR